MGDYERDAQKLVNAAKNYIRQSSYITKVRRLPFILFHSMSNGATCKHTGLVVSHKLDVRMHVSDEYGVLYAKQFGRLLGIKV